MSATSKAGVSQGANALHPGSVARLRHGRRFRWASAAARRTMTTARYGPRIRSSLDCILMSAPRARGSTGERASRGRPITTRRRSAPTRTVTTSGVVVLLVAHRRGEVAQQPQRDLAVARRVAAPVSEQRQLVLDVRVVGRGPRTPAPRRAPSRRARSAAGAVPSGVAPSSAGLVRVSSVSSPTARTRSAMASLQPCRAENSARNSSIFG